MTRNRDSHPSTHRRDDLRSRTRRELLRNSVMLAVIAAGSIVAVADTPRAPPVPMYDSSLTGQMWMDELLAGHPQRFYNAMGMHKDVFKRLLEELKSRGGLGDTKHVSAEEQLGIFLYTAVTGLSTRHVQERFQRSPSTVTKSELFPLI